MKLVSKYGFYFIRILEKLLNQLNFILLIILKSGNKNTYMRENNTKKKDKLNNVARKALRHLENVSSFHEKGRL